ncbi:manganese efflux pump MntP family protein [Bacteroidota bacterium]
MDSFAVSVANGFSISDLKIKTILKIAIFFSVFQAVMPVIGWAVGLSLEKYIKNFDHWLAFILLTFLGIKMIIEGIKKARNPVFVCEIKTFSIIIQSLATSIDALIIGISFALLNISILKPVIIIGLTTLLFSIAGIFIGKHFGNKFSRQFYYAGGVLLILIGIRIVFEHMT